MPRGSLAEDDPALGQIVGRHFDMYAVSNDRSDTIATHLASSVADDAVLIIEGDAETSVRQDLVDRAFHRDELFFRQTIALSVRKIIRADVFRHGAVVCEKELVPNLRSGAYLGCNNPSQTTSGKINIAVSEKITMALDWLLHLSVCQQYFPGLVAEPFRRGGC